MCINEFSFEPIKIQMPGPHENQVRDDAIIELVDNKLKLSQGVMEMLGIQANDRFVVNYWNVSPEETFPVVGTPGMFGLDSDNGNRVTKSRTVSYRGQQKDILLQYGNHFRLEPFKSYYKLVPIKEITENCDFSEDEKALNELNNILN